jgi:hypothetical protein
METCMPSRIAHHETPFPTTDTPQLAKVAVGASTCPQK